jgi:rfaE bifunctional protein nucleotidyltransferase chain/domain
MNSKIIAPDQIEETVARLKKEGKTVATLNGSFDLLHAGHLVILHQGAAQADTLVVALNSDASIQQYKSADRPIITLSHRLEMIASLECVTLVTWFDETDPRAILEKIKPDVHVNGAEYGEDCIEKETVEKNGGHVHTVERVPSLSTTEIINRIHQTCG